MTIYAWLLLDLTLALLVLTLGWASMASPDLKRGVVLFIAFGMLLALIWARLRAPDLALAEAVIGAGLTGALLLSELRDEPDLKQVGRGRDWFGWWLGLLTLGLAGVMGWALSHALIWHSNSGQADAIAAALPESGVSNPVTAVLLNFRAYDTMLELAVLLSALLGILALGPARPAYRIAGPVLAGLARWLLPLLVVTAGYLLWVGAHAPGGAFQAGALLASAAVLLRLGGRADAGLPGPAARRWLLVAGVAAFVAVGLAGLLGGGAFLQYPEGWAGGLILLIESAATLSIAVTLALAFIGGRQSDPLASPVEKESSPC